MARVARRSYDERVKTSILAVRVLAFAGLVSGFAPRVAAQVPPSGSRFVEGIVEFPKGTPTDESPTVVADATGMAQFEQHRAVCTPDGKFRVAFAPDATSGWLRLEARYLYLERDVAWRSDETVDPALGGVVLKPLLGGAVRGTLTSTADAAAVEALAARFAGATVELVGTPLQPGANPETRRVRVDAHLGFECGGLAPDHEWSATLAVPGFVPLFAESLLLKPGEVTSVRWPIRHGATLVGRVVDDAGVPVSGADLDVLSDELLFVSVPAEVAGHRRSDARGEFTLTGVPVGRVTLHAHRDGYWPTHVVLDELREDETRAGLVVVLPTGNVVTGRVLDPERRPAAGARVRVVQARTNAPTLEREVVAGADGSFRLGGLYDARVTITAVLELDAPAANEARGASDPAAGRRAVRAPQRLRWRAVVDGVEPDRRDLEIVLVPGLTVRGRVFDDLGRTITRYKAGARRAIGTDPHAQPIVIDVDDPEGQFELRDLEPGEWDVFAYGRGIVYAPPRRVTVPYTGEDVVFVVRRPASVSGIVLDARREPVAKALVEIAWDRPQLIGGAMSTETTSVTAAADGRFEVTEVFPGAVRVLVTPVGGQKSRAYPLELTSGATRSGVEIVLDP